MDSSETKDAKPDKTLVNKLLKKLTNHYYDDLKRLCDVAGYHLVDLMPKSRESFSEKGSPSEIENIRFLHHDENRVAKIMKIANDLATSSENNLYRSQSTLNIMKQLGILVPSKRKNSRTSSMSGTDYYKTFTNPKEIIQFNYEKEKEKYNKSLHMIEKISTIKEEAQRKVEQKLKSFSEREKKLLAERQKKEEDHEKHTQVQVERRKQILNKKYQIEQSINRQCVEIGELLEQRMNQLTEKEKKILRDKMKKKQEKIKIRINNDFQKIIMDEKKIKEEEKAVEVMIKELHHKIESRVHQYEHNVKKKMQTARSHSEKVDQKFSKCLKEDSVKQEEKLKKIVYKSQLCEEKKEKKTNLAQENAEKLKTDIEKCFDRQNKGIQDINYAELKRQEEIEQREMEKLKTFTEIKGQIEKIYQNKRYKNYKNERTHSATYTHKQELHVSFT